MPRETQRTALSQSSRHRTGVRIRAGCLPTRRRLRGQRRDRLEGTLGSRGLGFRVWGLGFRV